MGRLSPNERQQSVLHGLGVLLVAWQFLPKGAVFEKGAQHCGEGGDDGKHKRGNRIEQDGRAEGEQDRAARALI